MSIEDLADGGLTRRRFLELALASGVGGVAAGWASRAAATTVSQAAAVPPAGSDLGAIEHVIFLMQENRSFDHYFGTYKGVRGFDDHRGSDLGPFAQSFPHAPAGHKGKVLPFHINSASGRGECIHDLSHVWLAQHLSWNHGAMDSFVKTHTMQDYEGPKYGTITMGYYTRADLPFYYALADAFTLCDGYHCSIMGPTHPNRLMQVSGTIDPEGHHGGPILITYSTADKRFSVDWPTMPEVLQDAGIAWKVYSPPANVYRATFPEVLGISDSVFPYFKQYSNPKSELWKRAFNPTYPTDFRHDIANNTLPQVSWIIPPLGYDEHPPAPIGLGQWHTSQIIETLVANKELWSKTVLFLMHDENDGLFDHVRPPVAPRGTPGEYVTTHPLPGTAQTVAGPLGLGFRVPMLVISPFSRGGYVCSDTFDHTSQLRFLEERFGVKAPNISEWRRKTVGDLTATLSMTSPDTTVPVLPSTKGDTLAAVKKLGATDLDIDEITYKMAPYPLPRHPLMPTQEPGVAKRRT